MGKNEDSTPGVSDEEWSRFMEQAAQGAGDAPKEPSARARMVTERLRATQGQEPPGWRTGPARREPRRLGRLKAAAAVAAIAALALVAVRPELVIDRVTGKAQAREEAAKAGPLPAESTRPTAAPPSLPPDQPTLSEPFRGSPALQWADGAAGIEIPEATAVNGVSRELVAQGLERTKQFLVLANLDPATLRGERPTAALQMIDPGQRQMVDLLEGALARPGRDADPLQVFTRADPAQVRLVGDVVKVRGRMTVEPGESPGQVDIMTDYTFVYPLAQAKSGAEEVSRTIVRRQMEFTFADPRKWRVEAGMMQIGPYTYDIANSECFVHDGYLHPMFRDAPADGPVPSGPPRDPYDRSQALQQHEEEGCGTVSRT
ncbi:MULTISPECIES: hypothetical protein [unclassified Streptomyces]|uniref:hypothetical protein n=1 Tax=unclassified Streptomyces TaxID=2593676 RepID=UPI0005ECD47A|nr:MULTISPECIES: hypothetical protein [unclassified Streptomyces]APU41689.1 hypothetical protein BSL84_19950 [Streptomyces sp. TN58]KJK46129.1 hypothetical protein UK14_24005 [Streptomyces sp. NRRL F-4428]